MAVGLHCCLVTIRWDLSDPSRSLGSPLFPNTSWMLRPGECSYLAPWPDPFSFMYVISLASICIWICDPCSKPCRHLISLPLLPMIADLKISIQPGWCQLHGIPPGLAARRAQSGNCFSSIFFPWNIQKSLRRNGVETVTSSWRSLIGVSFDFKWTSCPQSKWPNVYKLRLLNTNRGSIISLNEKSYPKFH